MPVLLALCSREIRKFLRDRNRVAGALGQPLLFWVLIGTGFRSTFQMQGGDGGPGYLEFLFPGTIAMVILFTALFSTISIVEERQSGFIQAALTAPVSRGTLVLGTMLGGTVLALMQAALFMPALPFLGLHSTLPGLLLVLSAATLLGLTFTGLGVWLGWRMETTRGFHAVMNLFLMPLWLLSGAVFPVSGAAPVMQLVMRANPVTYGVSLLRQGLYWPGPAPEEAASWPVALTLSTACALVVFALATWSAQRGVPSA